MSTTAIYALIGGLWVIFILLSFYVYLTWQEKINDKHKDLIRKCWYLVFIFASLIFLTVDHNSLFTHWERYLIAIVAFVIIDSLFFLNLYISKFLGNEIDWASDQVVVTQEIIDMSRDKINNMEKVLNTYSHIEEEIDQLDAYVLELENFLNAYGKLEQLTIEIIPIRNKNEKNALFKDKQLKRFRQRIEAWENCYSSKDKIALIPLSILEREYVAKVTNENKNAIIESIDGQVINMLLVVYTLSVKVNINNEDGDSDV